MPNFGQPTISMCRSIHKPHSSVILAAALAATAGAQTGHAAQPLHLMPLPQSVTVQSGTFPVDEHFHAGFDGAHDARLDAAVDRFLRRLDRQCGGVRRAQFGGEVNANNTLVVKVAGPGDIVQSLNEDESYSVIITPQSAKLSATTDVGAMHAMETFLQLVETGDGKCYLPSVTIQDAPRFRWRGFMLDVSRHFEPVQVIERTLDGMAVAKLNVFHWHLSDDQGFRAESKKFPRFTEVASGGMFYTQDQMREVVAYARARGIRVVPEFDIPGHSSSWLVAYPEIGSGQDIKELPQGYGIPESELDPSNEKTYKFLETFVGEMGEIFPDAWFHIGGDETDGKGWLANPRIAEFMKKQGFSTPAELQAYFNRRLLPILKKHHKAMMGWDEILNPALPKDIMIQSWRGVESLSAGALQGYAGILSAPYYLDAQKTSAEMFLADPIPSDTTLTQDQQKLVFGGEVCMWAEQVHPETVDSRVWPRTAAIAERLWSAQSDRDVSDMYRRLRILSLELEDVGLTHITGPEKLRRNLWGSAHSEALDTLAAVIEPISFGERSELQHTDSLTALNRMVDAVVADPPSRQHIENLVNAATASDHAQSKAAEMELRGLFSRWIEVAPEVEVFAHQSPRLSDLASRSEQLSALGTLGLQALAYLDQRSGAPAGWSDAQVAVIADAEKPSALVRFAFLPSLRKLVQAAAKPPQL